MGTFIDIALRAKRTAFADRVHLAYTYEGLMEGKPSDEVNARILAGVPKQMSKVFGDLPIHIEAPEFSRIEEDHPFFKGQRRMVSSMPPVMVAARFISYSAVREGDASALVIVWFQHACSPLLDEALRPRLEAVDWEANAKDFCW